MVRRFQDLKCLQNEQLHSTENVDKTIVTPLFVFIQCGAANCGKMFNSSQLHLTHILIDWLGLKSKFGPLAAILKKNFNFRSVSVVTADP